MALIFIAIATALYFALAPGRVARGTLAGLATQSSQLTASVIHPVPTEHALTVRLTGTVSLERKATILSEVLGRVAWVSPKFSNGGSIAADETFIRIDSSEYEIRVKAAEAAVRSAQSDTELAKAQAELQLAALDLERTKISFPFDIRVISADVEIGQLVGPEIIGPASVLGIVYRPEALQVDVPIERRDLDYLDPVIGRSARVLGRMGTWDARVVRISSVVTPKTRLATVFLEFSGSARPRSRPAPGSFVEVAMRGPTHRDVYVLPDSVQQEGDSVWLVRDGALTAVVPETIGHTVAGWIVKAFDTADGVVVGTLPSAREGLAVAVADSVSSQ